MSSTITINASLTSEEKETLLRSQKKQYPLLGWRKRWVLFQRSLRILVVTWTTYRSINKTRRVLRQLLTMQKQVIGGGKTTKLISVNGSNYVRMHIPALGSSEQKQFIRSELHRILPHNKSTHRIELAHVAITRKCPLRCEHCFEWENLNHSEVLSFNDLDTIVGKLQHLGTTTIGFTGGEPMLRVNDMVRLMEKYTQPLFWVLTSGFNFTDENANRLQQAGLHGVIVSLDHYLEDQHDRFRGKEGAYVDALNTVTRSLNRDLVTALSVCLTRENCTSSFLESYMNLARDLGVGFVQFLEPKAEGHYLGLDVTLRDAQITLLEEYYQQYNHHQAYAHYPIIIYHGYYQRRMGCLSSGNRSLYIDTQGDLMACPFCRSVSGNALTDEFENQVDQMYAGGCKPFGSFPAIRQKQPLNLA